LFTPFIYFFLDFYLFLGIFLWQEFTFDIFQVASNLFYVKIEFGWLASAFIGFIKFGYTSADPNS